MSKKKSRKELAEIIKVSRLNANLMTDDALFFQIADSIDKEIETKHLLTPKRKIFLKKVIKRRAPTSKVLEGRILFNERFYQMQKYICIDGKPKKIMNLDSTLAILINAVLNDLSNATITAIITLVYKFGVDNICSIGIRRGLKKKMVHE